MMPLNLSGALSWGSLEREPSIPQTDTSTENARKQSRSVTPQSAVSWQAIGRVRRNRCKGLGVPRALPEGLCLWGRPHRTDVECRLWESQVQEPPMRSQHARHWNAAEGPTLALPEVVVLDRTRAPRELCLQVAHVREAAEKYMQLNRRFRSSLRHNSRNASAPEQRQSKRRPARIRHKALHQNSATRIRCLSWSPMMSCLDQRMKRTNA